MAPSGSETGLGRGRLFAALGAAWLFLAAAFASSPPVSPVPHLAAAAALVAATAWSVARARRGRASALAASRLDAALADARLRTLRMQLNPHFLFNTLNTILSLVPTDPPAARRTTTLLTDLLRRTLDESDRPFARLGDEIEFIGRYLAIEKTRFGPRLEVEVRVSAEAAEASVPSLLLQPLVENAIKHGVAHGAGTGRVGIDARVEAGRLLVSVTDDGPGPGRSPTSASGGVGFQNAAARLAQMFGDEGALLLRERPTGGAESLVRVPFRRFDESARPAAEPS